MRAGTSWVILYILLLFLMLFSRYASAPVTDFISDDWPILERSRNYDSYGTVVSLALQETDRPIGALLLGTMFRLVDDRPALFSLHHVGYHAIILLLFLYATRQLTGNRRAVLIAGVVFALLPHASDLYNWTTVAVYLPAFVFYLAAMVFWLWYWQKGRFVWSIASGICMLLGSATFEAGFALPLAFLALVRRESLTRDLSAVACTGAGSALYLLWRFTRGFGMTRGVLFEPRQPSVDPYHLMWNAKEFISTWAGENLIDGITWGLRGFGTLPEWEWRGLYAASMVVTAIICMLLLKLRENPNTMGTRRPGKMRLLLFSALWFSSTALPCIVSWQAGRLQFLPGMAVSFAAGLLLADRKPGTWFPAAGVVIMLLLLVNLGSAQLWQDSGRFHRALYNHVCATQKQWESKDLVLFSTDTLRTRLTPGLLTPDDQSVYAWAQYGSAALLRGFAPAAMLQLANRSGKGPVSILDMEHGAAWEGDSLHWHTRWNPEAAFLAPRERVFMIDVLKATTTPSPISGP